ncbi:glutathione S-transferase N-terminal domain-containing protein [Thiomicrorhabdus lithotrophica]|uniref:Glutathione S-transferase N-terminal domain-containing protein n=2 Tax=Thiomicrorhabdus lithotrophica TaxID=2949997 RepID=A0ABY8CEV0_9GAMM|nr:glutathione S-transferase N-terminal domain-containing protein [Thiomicrorhabdus lithotrophica]
MLNYINSEAKPPRVATIFTKPGCPFCAKAKVLLEANGISFEEITISNHGPSSKTLRAVAQADTVPQVFVEGEHIGGCDDLEVFLSK